MKKAAFQTYVFFVLILGAVFLATYYFYRLTSTEFLERKIADSLLTITENVDEAISYKMDSDYQRLEHYMDGKTYDEIDGEVLNGLLSEDIEFARITEDGLEYKGLLLLFNQTFIPENTIENKISIVNFSDMIIGTTDTKSYIFFNVNDVLFFIDSNSYLNKMFLSSEDLPENMYFLINKDGLIYYQLDMEANNKFYEYYLRSSNSEQVATSVKEQIYSGEASYKTSITFSNKEYYLCYSPVSNQSTSNEFYVVYLFETESAFSSMGMLTYQLVTLFGLYCLIVILAIIGIYIILMRKNSDIEGSMVIHYYDKPYIIRVNKKGKILGYNSTVRRTISRRMKYKYVNEFEHEDGVDLVDAIKKQTPFTVSFDDVDDLRKSVLMIPVKNIFSKYLVGTDITYQDSSYKSKTLHNQITNLPNLDLLLDVLDRHIKYLEHCAVKDREVLKSSIVLFDIKQFSNFNKVFGRKMGNQILCKISERVKKYLDGKNADLYHTEIDLFAIFFDSLESFEQVSAYVEEIIDLFKKPLEIDNNNLIVDIKCGIFNIELQKYDKLDARKAYENCQITLMQAKSLTSLKYAVYNATFSTAATKEQAMTKDLSIAIEKNEFVMFYQPQYNNEERRIVGFEALVRWDNPKYKFQSPAIFIELAEKNNMIIQIGRFIMDQTFQAAKRFEKYNIHVSMNVSPVQLMQAGFVNEVLECANKYELKAGSVAIEITETFLMENFNYIIEKLNLLRNKGFSIHLDDFGTGYSSMLYLKELPINTIKIDKEFIRHLATDKYSRAIVNKIVSLARSLELDIIAEGVEKDDQNQVLIKTGCNIIQGYLISRGVSFDDAMQLVNEYNVEKTKQIAKVKKVKKG